MSGVCQCRPTGHNIKRHVANDRRRRRRRTSSRRSFVVLSSDDIVGVSNCDEGLALNKRSSLRVDLRRRYRRQQVRRCLRGAVAKPPPIPSSTPPLIVDGDLSQTTRKTPPPGSRIHFRGKIQSPPTTVHKHPF